MLVLARLGCLLVAASSTRLRSGHERAVGQEPLASLPLIPFPADVKPAAAGSKAFVLSADAEIALGEGVQKDDPAVVSFRSVLAGLGDQTKKASLAESWAAGEAEAQITLSLKGKAEAGSTAEQGYTLSITDKAVSLEAPTSQGLFHGVQTLRQLITRSDEASSQAELPALTIVDAPRFAYRGLHLDVSRHFFTAKQVMKLLDVMALYKLNRFHWHLTDDQGWRLPVDDYPKLTQVGAQGGKAYTKEELKDVVAHATARHIDVIPEIDVPGHVEAALAAYPEMGNSDVPDWKVPTGPMEHWGISSYTLAPNNATWTFLSKVYDTLDELFPSKIVHIGGDEVSTGEWSQSPRAKAAGAAAASASSSLAEQGGGEEAQEVAKLFNSKIVDFLKAKGRRAGAWNEAQHTGNFPSDGIVYAWNSAHEATAAAEAGRQTVVADMQVLYFDHAQASQGEPEDQGGCSSWENVIQYEIMPEGLSEDKQKLVIGAQGQLWSEYFPNWEHAEYMAHPRSLALAERTWSPKAKEGKADSEEFKGRLTKRLADLDQLGVNYRKLSASGCGTHR